MISLIIAWKDFKIRITDRKGFIIMLAMPLLLTAILGAALSSIMGNTDEFANSKIGIYQKDGDALASTFKKDVLPKLDILKVKTYGSQKRLQKAVDNNEVDAGIVLPKHWGKGLSKGEISKATILENSDKNIQASIVNSIVTSFSSKFSLLLKLRLLPNGYCRNGSSHSGQVGYENFCPGFKQSA